ncbi:hypothetical protein E4U17_004908 [Claviceps sp. LM77 group G4]|nr:hypothetical protein E4U17_004908 [Claviceps sp. LM77 group G4]KAG6070761.1 hypothetical protein E4U33_004045 [Claviceps sp. LM78 group G4]KAG6076638.1 hypothetical protein E4U16_002665 [Claviceps sp. LM84 group G4]
MPSGMDDLRRPCGKRKVSRIGAAMERQASRDLGKCRSSIRWIIMDVHCQFVMDGEWQEEWQEPPSAKESPARRRLAGRRIRNSPKFNPIHLDAGYDNLTRLIKVHDMG